MIFASFLCHSQSAREELQLTDTSARLGLRILFAVILAFQGGVLFAQCDSGSDSGSGSGSSAVADLDAYSGAAAVYSVRLVYSTYAGSALEVRRGSDNQTQIIGFDSNGAMDTAALETFCSGTDCYVTTWYDQSGNGKDATQTSPSSQPQIYDSADGVVLENARPALLFDGDDYLTSENVLSGTTNRSLFSVHRRDGDQGSWTSLYAPGTASPNGTGMIFAGFKEKMGVHIRNGKEQVNYTAGYQYLMSYTLGETDITSSQFHVNGIELPASSQLSLGVNTTSTDSHIGGSWRSNPSTKAWKGTQQELLFYASDEASNREAIEENMNAYFRVIPSYDEGVPFQDNPFLLNPSVTAETSGSNPTLHMTTFESQLLSMIKELEDAIAAANGTEPNYGQYTEAVDLGGGVMAMNYNVLDLRDAVVSLQTELDEALVATVVSTDNAADVEQEYAKLHGSVTSNVQPLQDWGFVFDTDEAFATSDTIDIPFTAEQITEFATSESDTGSFYLEQSALDPSTTYYFKAYATDCGEVVYGSSVSFTTLAAATTVDGVEDKTDSTGTLQASFVYGSVLPTVGFQWGLEADLSDATSNEVTMGADSTIQLALTGLQKDSTYYYTSYATNSGGTAYGDTLSFIASSVSCESPTFDGYDYDVVVIGDQCWFAENLQTTVYADGSAIPEVTDDTAWAELTSDAQCVHGNESSNLETYGRLYNWYAVDDSRGLCPAGWHVASDAEFTELSDFLGGSEVAGDKLKSSATDTPAWDGTNSSGWSGLPGAFRFGPHPDLGYGAFGDVLGSAGYWWTSTRGDWDNDPTYAWDRFIYVDAPSLELDASPHSYGYSVRCLRDTSSAPVVSTSAASAVTDTTATLNGSVVYNWDPISATGFKWGYAADLSDATDVPGDTLTGDFTVDLTGLVTNDSLYYVAYATNSLGTTFGDTLGIDVRNPACEDLTSVTFDGYDYDLVSIGDQCWFAENLQTTLYADGSEIEEVNAESEFNPEFQVFSPLWGLLTSGARCSYDNDSNNVDTYGLLYNWYAVDDSRGLCPSGWHVPTDAEWDTLRTQLGGISIAGDKMKSSASDSPSWDGTNSSGFSGLPGGYRHPGGTFSNVGSKGTWWSSSTPIGDEAWCWNLYAGATNFGRDDEGRRSGFSVRCLRDSSSAPVVSTSAASSVTDTTATLNGSVDFNWESISATGFKWGYAADLSDATDVAGDTLAGNFTAGLTGLVTNDTLYFVAYATNSLGTTYGDTLSFEVDETPCSDLTSLTFDGYDYELVSIGDQCWFAENLQTTLYADGSEIPEVTDGTDWDALTSGARCDYDNDSANVESYGRLYNFYAVDDSRGLCPAGWHVPTKVEFEVLSDFVGYPLWPGESLKSSPTDTPPWDGTNIVGWSGVPGGERITYTEVGEFRSLGVTGNYWSTTREGDAIRFMNLYSSSPDYYTALPSHKRGLSVRCLRDAPSAPVVSTSAASLVTDTTATLNGSVNFHYRVPISASGFKWGYAADLSDATDVAGDTLAGDFTVELTDLVTNNTLYFVAYATNALGTTYGDTLSVRVTGPCEGLNSYTFDGYDYDLVEIGDQCWFAENLQTTLYADGSEISEVTDNTAWGALTSGARCDYDNDASNVESYGRLYNWYAVDDSRGLCPSGWHVASDPEFTVLAEFLGGSSIAGDKLKASATDTPAWDGTNSSGWSGLPGGMRFGGNQNGATYGAFSAVGSFAAWWASSTDTTSIESAWHRYLDPGQTYIERWGYTYGAGFSVRCLRDSSSAPVVSTSAASAVTETTATLNGSADYNHWYPLSATGFKWGYASDLSDATDVLGDTLAGNFTADLTDLVTNETLYFVAYATNALGTTYGDTLSFEVRTPACEDLTSVTFDGYDYDLVSIGDQCWFAENLRTVVYSNGDSIPVNGNDWQTTTAGAMAINNEAGTDEAQNLTDYGRLYNGHAVADARGLCPSGWHIPTEEEFTELETGLDPNHAYALKSSATDTPAWDGTNSSGWSGLPGGWFSPNGYGENTGLAGYWWTSTVDGDQTRSMKLDANIVGSNSSHPSYYNYFGLSIRCLRDSASAPVVSTSAASAVTDTTATLNGSVVYNWDPISATGFKWGYAADLSDATDVPGDTLAGDFTVDLTGLVTNDSLYYVAYATNSLGTTYGDTLGIDVRTPACEDLTSVTFDGYEYDLVSIGDQCWFAENLRSSVYADGSAIQEVTDNAAWLALATGARSDYNNESDSAVIYGRLYNWYAVDDSRGLCPTGWHVPTDEEFTTLTDFLGGSAVAGEKMKSSATDTPSWNGTNVSGWSGLPAGIRSTGGSFSNAGNDGKWWSSSLNGSYAWRRHLYVEFPNAFRAEEDLHYGFSVRCLRDSASAPVVSTSASTDVTSTTATLNGTVDFNWESISATGFKWGYAADLSDATDVAGDTLVDDFTTDLTDLVTDDSLYFAAYATNALGTTYGDTLSFKVTGPCASLNSFTFDGYDYDIVPIGDQCWFAENLRSENYNDGSPIPYETADDLWANLTTGARAGYNHEGWAWETYGGLYNWHAVDDPRGLCPTGWHVPTEAEFTTLMDVLGGPSGSTASDALKSSEGWINSNGTNSSGWSGLPGGRRNWDGSFDVEGYIGNWWSSSEQMCNISQGCATYLNVSNMHTIGDGGKRNGYSIRCLRDSGLPVASTVEASAVTDTTATLNGSTDFNLWESISATGFKWGYTADLSDATDVAGDALVDGFTADLTNLVMNNTLYFVAYATNGLGTTYGDTLSFEVKNPPCEDFTSVTFDGYDYDVVSIGDQCWFAENLRSENYNDGSPIPYETANELWENLTSGARAVYEHDGSSFETYGGLYNWYAVDDPRGLCPTGWHVPSKNEFTVLAESLGGFSIAGPELKSSATDTPAWNGTNSSGWSGLPGGSRRDGGDFEYEGSRGIWWSATDGSRRTLQESSDTFSSANYDANSGYSVRCLRDNLSPVVSTVTESSVTDSTATLNGSVDFNYWYPISATGFKWGYTADLSDATIVAGDALLGSFSVDLTSPVTGNVVYFTAFATNDRGTTYGDTLSFEVKNPACGSLTSLTFDGYDYDVVSVGDQCWFAENLRSENYNDGSPIPYETANDLWENLTTGARAAYDHEGWAWETYGGMYNWYAVNDSRGLCPTGWHVPTNTDFSTLVAFLGYSGDKMKSSASDSPAWNGTNSSGWSGLPGGRRQWNGLFTQVNEAGFWWSASLYDWDDSKSYYWYLYDNNDVYWSSMEHSVGLSVRCLRDSESPVVSTAEATPLTDTTATLNGSVDLNHWYPISATGFKWSYAADLSDATDVVGDALVGDFTADLTDLVTGNTVYFTAFATNALETAYGDTLSFEVQGPACGDLTSLTFDGYDYDVVSIGDQCWFAENLRSENYNDGSPIPYETANDLWANLTTGARAVYNHEGWASDAYGGMYNWYAVNDARGLCPTGWHVPTYEEHITLRNFLGFNSNSVKSSAFDTPSWNGANTSGWSGLPGGQRQASGFYLEGETANFWTSSDGSATHAYALVLKTETTQFHTYSFEFYRGLSVRCLKDAD